jgi:hypothetical protein
MAAVQIRLVYPQSSCVDVADSLEDAVMVLREHWNKEKGPQVFLVNGERGEVLAELQRHGQESEVCITTFADGRTELHRCTYIERDGWYDRTAVTELRAPYAWDRISA